MARRIVGIISIISLIIATVLLISSIYCLIAVPDFFISLLVSGFIFVGFGVFSFVITGAIPKNDDNDNYFGW